MWIPWCSDGNDFENKHIEVVVGRRKFAIWQATHDDGERVRFTVGDVDHLAVWKPFATWIGGYAGSGVLENAVTGPLRSLVIHEAAVWLVPAITIDALAGLGTAMAIDDFHLCADREGRAVPSVPKLSATAFSMAGIPSDAFDAGRPGARLLYRDGGKRYEYTIANGALSVQPQPASPVLREAISYHETRHGDPIPVPQFDLVAANGSRVFAKEAGRDRFFFAIVDAMYVHAGPDGREFTIPGMYFKLDPEFNVRGLTFATRSRTSTATSRFIRRRGSSRCTGSGSDSRSFRSSTFASNAACGI